MTIFNKRNALLGYVTLKALERRRTRKQLRRKAPKIALFSLVGLLSLGIVAGIGAVLLKRHREEPRHLEGYAEGDESESEIVGEYVTANPEPIPAT